MKKYSATTVELQHSYSYTHEKVLDYNCRVTALIFVPVNMKKYSTKSLEPNI